MNEVGKDSGHILGHLCNSKVVLVVQVLTVAAQQVLWPTHMSPGVCLVGSQAWVSTAAPAPHSSCSSSFELRGANQNL